MRNCGYGTRNIKSRHIYSTYPMLANVLFHLGNISHTYTLSRCVQWTDRRSDHCMHIHDPLRLLRTRNLDTQNHRSSRPPLLPGLPRILWLLLSTRSLGTHAGKHPLRHPCPSMRNQRRQSTKSKQPPRPTSLSRMDTYGGLHVLNRRMVILTLLDTNGRKPPRPLLPHNVLRLRTHDNKNNPRSPHQTTIPLLDNDARSSRRRSYPR